MSSLWTPSGEHRPEPAAAGGDGGRDGGGEPDEAAVAEELRRVRAELAATPVVDLIANHGIGLWQLAVLHLVPEDEEAPRLVDAALAIDALAQLRMAYVQVQERDAEHEGEDGDT